MAYRQAGYLGSSGHATAGLSPQLADLNPAAATSKALDIAASGEVGKTTQSPAQAPHQLGLLGQFVNLRVNENHTGESIQLCTAPHCMVCAKPGWHLA